MGGEVRAGRREGLWVVARRKWVCTQGRSYTQDLGARARAGRTSNMLSMPVTLEVSQLSGWLKACAFCRVEREGHAMRGDVQAGRREGVGWWWRERRARGKGPTQGLGGRARAERTLNMPYMAVTVEVSKLSGWLSFCAPCQPKGGACDMGRGAGGEAVGSGAAQAGMQTGGRSDSRLGGQGTRGAHGEHVVHVRDAGGVPAQRLVECLRNLPSPREGTRCRARCALGGRRAWGGGGGCGMHGDGPTQDLGARARA